jgi:hydroxypyruvate isomerase
MLRFAANLNWLFTEEPFLQRFAAAARAGFRAVEFPSPYAHAPQEIAARLHDNGLRCVLFNLPMGERSRGDIGLACRPGREGEFREGVARALDYAAHLGPARINCIAGVTAPGEDGDAHERVLVENLRFAAAEFKTCGLDLVVEPLNSVDNPGYHLPRALDGARVVGAVDAPNFGLQLDLYHTAMMGDDCAALLDELAPVIRHIQFADAPGRGEPGTGRIDFAPLFDRIGRSSYAGWVAAEYRPSRPTAETLHWFAAAS